MIGCQWLSGSSSHHSNARINSHLGARISQRNHPPAVPFPPDHVRLLSGGRARRQPLLHRGRRCGPRRRRGRHAPRGAPACARFCGRARAGLGGVWGDARGRGLVCCGEHLPGRVGLVCTGSERQPFAFCQYLACTRVLWSLAIRPVSNYPKRKTGCASITPAVLTGARC